MNIRISHIEPSSYVDGPGERQVVFVQGCPNRCPGCQNAALQDPQGGTLVDVEQLAGYLVNVGKPITISGGEPFAQDDAVAALLSIIRSRDPKRHIIVYSGFTLEKIVEGITEGHYSGAYTILSLANVLVDGPYIADLDHDKMQWRGSSNQRPINLCGTHWWTSEPRLELEDWDTQVLAIGDFGQIVGTAGTMRELFDEGVEPTRMCGETSK